jgi:hypothetical protein
LDEAAFIEEELWRAARYTILARPGSRAVLASTPYGRRDHFFAVLWRAGERGEDGFASFRWPSTVSPLVDEELLRLWRETSTSREYAAEVEAQWQDDQGAVFSSELIESAVDDYELIVPAEADGLPTVAGVDWGRSHDASAITLVAERDGGVLWVPWLMEKFDTPFSQFIDEVVSVARGYRITRLMSEVTGIGSGPTEFLTRRLAEARIPTRVIPINTTSSAKQDWFGTLVLRMERGELRLPRHAELLRQMAAAEYVTLEGGTVRIAVPDRGGAHDDLLMSLALAAGQLVRNRRYSGEQMVDFARQVNRLNAGLRRTSVWRGSGVSWRDTPRPG